MSPPGLRRGVLLFLAVALIFATFGYALFESRRLIEGPRLVIYTPLDGSATSSASITLAGFAENISFLTINGLPAYIDESGHFTHTLSPAPGYAIFTVAATDRFGRQASKSVHINILNFCQIA